MLRSEEKPINSVGIRGGLPRNSCQNVGRRPVMSGDISRAAVVWDGVLEKNRTGRTNRGTQAESQRIVAQGLLSALTIPGCN